MGLFAYIGRKVAEAATIALQDGPGALETHLGELRDRVSKLESEHRRDHLEVLDLHERVKTNLTKMIRRARDSPGGDDLPADDSLVKPAKPAPKVQLMSRRGRG